MDEIEKDYDSICEEINNNVDQAIKLLENAVSLYGQLKHNDTIKNYDSWYELQEVVSNFIDLDGSDNYWSSSCLST